MPFQLAGIQEAEGIERGRRGLVLAPIWDTKLERLAVQRMVPRVVISHGSNNNETGYEPIWAASRWNLLETQRGES